MGLTSISSSLRNDDKQVEHHISSREASRRRLATSHFCEENADDPTNFLCKTRLCESLYYVFLSGYQSGLEAYWNRSVERSSVLHCQSDITGRVPYNV
jgi:hypothetical protein